MRQGVLDSRQRSKQLYRQGDVLLKRTEALPMGVNVKGIAVSRPSGVLAEGEATGHAHRVEDPAAAHVLAMGDKLYLRVRGGGVRVTHEEHAPITLEPGDYEVIRQREY